MTKECNTKQENVFCVKTDLFLVSLRRVKPDTHIFSFFVSAVNIDEVIRLCEDFSEKLKTSTKFKFIVEEMVTACLNIPSKENDGFFCHCEEPAAILRKQEAGDEAI